MCDQDLRQYPVDSLIVELRRRKCLVREFEDDDSRWILKYPCGAPPDE